MGRLCLSLSIEAAAPSLWPDPLIDSVSFLGYRPGTPGHLRLPCQRGGVGAHRRWAHDRSFVVRCVQGKTKRLSTRHPYWDIGKYDPLSILLRMRGRRSSRGGGGGGGVVVGVVVLFLLLLVGDVECGGAAEEWNSKYALYQHDDGSLCVDGDCYDANDQIHLSDIQLQLLMQQQQQEQQQQTEQPPCQDWKDNCPVLIVAHGGCATNQTIQSWCPLSCEMCHSRNAHRQAHPPPRIQHVSSSISKRTKRIRTKIYNAWGSDLGAPQIFKDAKDDDMKQILEEARYYVQNEVMVDDLYQAARDKCRNKDAHCTRWAAQGQCDTEYDTLWEICAPVCHTCDQLHYTSRCPIDQNMRHALYPGDLNRLFERIVSDPIYEPLGITVLSRPSYAEGDTEDTASYILGPWVLQFDNFSTPEEAKTLIESGAVVGYERSEDVGEELDDGEVTGEVSTGRTSTNAWCDKDNCEIHPQVQSVLARIENVTGISRNYSESLQLLRYEVGQFYEEHHVRNQTRVVCVCVFKLSRLSTVVSPNHRSCRTTSNSTECESKVFEY